ncbi:nucleotidyltransferase family protein [Porphyrobacter sp. GA68]|uniref:nucleotidyltransferase family protein n=1 Tax=Porphyrobacter sp. GA68 TaxID=2883480 RepID=UPI001D1902C2|nr:nucleotidyltransferase family protein [Porphyrobacter sp. GA68]
MTQVTGVVLAGSRPGADPLLAGSGVTTKALLPVGGRPMLAYPLKALGDAGLFQRLLVCAQRLQDLERTLQPFAFVEARSSKASIAATLEMLLKEEQGPLLVTTADNVLLTAEMVQHFVEEARGADVAVAMVERRTLEAAGYSTRRTWLNFRGGAWSGANLFWLAGPQCLPLIRFWASIEQDRKKGWRIISAFGPLLALQAALRLANIGALVRRAGRRFGIAAKLVAMPQAEACIDADTPADIVLIERILAQREAGAAGA